MFGKLEPISDPPVQQGASDQLAIRELFPRICLLVRIPAQSATSAAKGPGTSTFGWPIEAANLAGLPHRRYSSVMRPLRYSINVTLDGCCDHRAIPADEELHRHAVENLDQADALLCGRVTYEMMEAAFRPPALVRNPG